VYGIRGTSTHPHIAAVAGVCTISFHVHGIVQTIVLLGKQNCESSHCRILQMSSLDNLTRSALRPRSISLQHVSDKSFPPHVDMTQSALSEHGDGAVLDTALSGYVDLNLIYCLMGHAYHAASHDF